MFHLEGGIIGRRNCCMIQLGMMGLKLECNTCPIEEELAAYKNADTNPTKTRELATKGGINNNPHADLPELQVHFRGTIEQLQSFCKAGAKRGLCLGKPKI